MDTNATPFSYRFGAFELAPQQRRLSAGGQTLPLSSRAFDILNLLVEHRARIVTKDEIISTVWRGMIVDDNNLAVQISALRRALAEHAGGETVIATVPGQGYRFVATLEETPAAAEPAETPQAEARAEITPEPARPRRRFLWPALAAGLAMLLAVAVLARLRHAPPEPPRLSIAVLPFRNLSEDTRQTYLADAITDDLTTDLSHIPGSKVIARESSDAYRNQSVPTPAIGAALGVRYLLEGSLRREADTLHINAQLIDAASGAHLWASAFDVGRDGLATARTDIVRRLAAVLDYTLVQVESARSLQEKPANPDAMDFYLRARSTLDRNNDFASLQEAQALFEHAITLAPDYADALAGLGKVLLRKIRNFDDPNEWEDHARAQEVINQALRRSPRNVAAITAAGALAEMDWHCDTARENFRLALSLQPDDLDAHSGLAFCALQLGEMQQMIAEFQTILRIDPSGPNAATRKHLIGMGHLMLGEPTEALDWLNRAGALISPDALPDTSLGWREWHQIYTIAALQIAGDSVAAAREYRTYATLHPHRTVWRLDSYASHAVSILPGHKAYCEALHKAGMPIFASDDGDVIVGSVALTEAPGDFDVTPHSITGAQNVTTLALYEMLHKERRPLVLDVGSGAGVIPGAISVWPPGVWGNRDQMLLDAAGKRAVRSSQPIVVMGDSPFGFAAYNAVKYLVAHGVSYVLWYRGGEEAWVQAGYPMEDRRSP